ncbi:UDP-N-acetylmuramate dehydrogenase [uncultured Sneathia sp.]|jgi:UDP-N-acetylmuramate dehydrogenase|uniref:UDP-N-acetylmuramate dehydrogenase n=1 Tax=uncultured Sneathia sp. TaxID=278067 RepID=UPI0028051523|nr:UDP-N-acetylmuramate dehydrogenase [uncultured Sneathia sp.]
MIVQENVSMREYSNMKIGGIAKSLIHIEKEDELKNLFKPNERYYLIGNGTNTLIYDGYLDINFVSLEKLNKIEDLGNNRVYVEAGVDLTTFTQYMRDHNLGGLENISGIPGSIGGLVNMNAGAYGTTIFDKIESVRVLVGNKEIKTLSKEELGYRYRGTKIKDNKWIVIGATFKLDDGFDVAACEDKLSKRQHNHPLDYPNLGSTFKNPEGQFAAQLISDCGLKKYRVGDMEVSEKHPNFLINHGNAKFSDVIDLIKHIKEVVYSKTGYMLDTEIIILK